VLISNCTQGDKELALADFVRMGGGIQDAILTIVKYIKAHTGVEPTQEEMAATLKSYFILNEVANQIKYQLNKAEKKEAQNQVSGKGPFWTLNLRNGPAKNMLVRAGVFHVSIQEAIQTLRQYIRETLGVAPGDDIIAKSLKSSFILSEIKNQLEYQRKQAQGKKT
jgi:hypothetical protein